jgi:hypothetical protein
MQNIEKNIADNIGGIYTFYFIPVADVVSIPLAVSKQISAAVVLADAKYFYSAEITLESFSYKEPQTDNEDGSSYAVSLGGFVAGDSSQLTDLFDEMSGGRFIVICEDSNNKKRLLGTIANGMRFKADFDTNNKTAGLKGWNILFAGLLSERPPFYQSVFSAYSTNAPLPVNDTDYLQSEIVLLQSAVAGKEPAIAAGSSAQYWRGDKSWQTLNTSVVPEGTNLYYTQARFDSAFTAKSTTNLSEGTNLYYTQARFDTAFTAKSTSNLSEGTNLYYTQARFDTAFTAKSTTNLSEGTNLYYTQARFDTAFTAKSTSNLSEGTNLYYTQARFDSAFTAKSTTNLSEGTNLYFTNARSIASTLTGYASGSGTISSADTLLGAIQKLNGNDTLKVSTGSAGSLLSLALTGTAGAGYLQLLSQSSPPSAVSGNMILYSNASNSFSLVKRNAANSADITRTFTFPDSSVTYIYPSPTTGGSDTLAVLGTAQTFTAAQTFSSTLNKITLTAPATAATLTLADNTTTSVTGGGTLALGGFTLTAPATGTVALLATTQTFTGSKTFQSSTTVNGLLLVGGSINSNADNGFQIGTQSTAFSSVFARVYNSSSGGNVILQTLTVNAGSSTGNATVTTGNLVTGVTTGGSSGSTTITTGNANVIDVSSGNLILSTGAITGGTGVRGSITIANNAAIKTGFWNTTPIVQPTTSFVSGTLVSNGGTALTSTDTIDGYTLLQLVKIIRSLGLAA